MSEGAALDTDIILKFSAYTMADELLAVISPLGKPSALGLTHIIAGSQMSRSKNVHNKERASTELVRLLSALSKLEPVAVELDLAAEMEGAAQRLNLFFDRGEAQLLAIVLTRSLPIMITGDKRAIAAVNRVLAVVGQSLIGRLVCLEQTLLAVLNVYSVAYVRPRICDEPHVDKAASISFSCGRTAYDLSAPSEGLSSYIGSVDATSEGALFFWDRQSSLF